MSCPTFNEMCEPKLIFAIYYTNNDNLIRLLNLLNKIWSHNFGLKTSVEATTSIDQ